MLKRRYFPLLVLLMMYIPSAARAQAFSASDAVENTANGTINWTAGEVYARGIGAAPARPANAAQARAMAQRAAFVTALRNLLETIKGIQVDSETLVENAMVKSDMIRTKVDGIVKGARIVKTEYMSDGSVEVLVGMNMKGEFLNAVTPENFGRPSTGQIPVFPAPALKPSPKPDIPAPEPTKLLPPAVPDKKSEPAKPEPKPSPAPPVLETRKEPVLPTPQPAPAAAEGSTLAFKGGLATGLVIDGRGLGLRPALLPRILDQQGHEVYVGQVVTRTNAVEQGVAGYAKDVSAAANNFRVTDNPAVIRALSASGATRTDLVIAGSDAQMLRQLASKGEFLQYCRVIIVY